VGGVYQAAANIETSIWHMLWIVVWVLDGYFVSYFLNYWRHEELVAAEVARNFEKNINPEEVKDRLVSDLKKELAMKTRPHEWN